MNVKMIPKTHFTFKDLKFLKHYYDMTIQHGIYTDDEWQILRQSVFFVLKCEHHH